MPHSWFFTPTLPEVGETTSLAAREARHAAGAKRLAPDDGITLFDGCGNLAEARILTLRKQSLDVEITHYWSEPPPHVRPHLACALPKGDRQGVLLSMATQLGMWRFTPLLCERSIVKPTAAFAERAQRIVIEACKQCRRAHVPTISPPAHLTDVLTSVGVPKSIAHPGGEPFGLIAAATTEGEPLILIGPEGGFTDDEINAATAAGATLISLGRNVLRIETAAVAALATCASLTW
jgi:16S rRNA (uracil1498-N3)-methyltransferase